jgi:hypothetical protein
VPAGWEVVDLAAHPHACVRFDRHALYLGAPGTDQVCPATAIGHTEAIVIEPASGGARTSALGAPANGILRIPGAGVTILASWSSHPSMIATALGRPVASLRQTAIPPPAGVRTSPIRMTGARNATAQSAALGFDACGAPSAQTMISWLASPYRTVGVYIGGENRACSQPNLTAAWVQAVTSEGWRLIPTYVGRQAAGACGGCLAITPASAFAQGVAAANTAAAEAAAIGIPPGNPIYDDMEGYSSGRVAVLAFLSGWTTQLHTDGYVSGVYSSVASGVTDLVNARGTSTVEPDDIWFARWNGTLSSADSALPAAAWGSHQRLHQYLGGHNERFGNVTINIDSNFIDGATASSQGWPPPDGSFVTYQGRNYQMVGGAPVLVSNWAAVGGIQATRVLNAHQWSALRSWPANGTLITAGLNGTVYELVGGAPMLVSGWTAIGGQRPVVAVDPWDLSHLANPTVRLRTTPADGTYVTSGATGQSYRIAGDAAFPITSWSAFGGPQVATTIDAWNLLHPSNPLSRLRAHPINGAVVQAIRAGSYWQFTAGYRTKVAAVPTAVAIDDSALAAYPPMTMCVVPRLRGLTVPAARAALRAARCALGLVTRRAGQHAVPHVVAQSAAAGARHRHGYRVGIAIR